MAPARQLQAQTLTPWPDTRAATLFLPQKGDDVSCCLTFMLQGWRTNTDPARGIRREKAFFKIKCPCKVEISSCQEPSHYPGGGTWEPATTSFSTPSRGDLDQLVAQLPREGGAASSPGNLCCHLSWALSGPQVFLLKKSCMEHSPWHRCCWSFSQWLCLLCWAWSQYHSLQ